MDPREQAYDEHIAPLMEKIIEVCQQHKIAMLCNFLIGSDESGADYCTSALMSKAYSPTKAQVEALMCIAPRRQILATILESSTDLKIKGIP